MVVHVGVFVREFLYCRGYVMFGCMLMIRVAWLGGVYVAAVRRGGGAFGRSGWLCALPAGTGVY